MATQEASRADAPSTRPPGPKNRHPLSQLPQLNRNRAKYFLHLARTYGDVVYFTIANQHIWLLNDPDLVKDVLLTNHRYFKKTHGYKHMGLILGNGILTSDGEHHRRQRRLLQPSFQKQRIAVYGKAIAEQALRYSAHWQDGQALDLNRELMQLALLIVAKNLFDADAKHDAAVVNEALDAFFATINRVENPLRPLLNVLPLPSNLRLKKARARLDALIFDIIRKRRDSGVDRGDVLSSLIAAQDEEGDGGGMSDVQMRDEVVTLFMAGHETTALTLTWTFYLLSQHPEAAEKLYTELDRVLAGAAPSVDDLERLPYTRSIIAETLRLYPPAYAIDRCAVEDFPLRNWTVRKGDTVVMSQFAMHRHPAYWPRPEVFDPDRWVPETQAQRPRFAYFPFGGGPRVCIGEQFAWMESMILLAILAQQWRVELAPGHTVDTEPVVTLRPKGGLPVILHRR